MNAARENKLDVAQLYLDSGLSGQETIELAKKVYVVLNSRLPVRVTNLSDRLGEGHQFEFGVAA